MSYFTHRDQDRARRNSYERNAKPVEPPTFPEAEKLKAERIARGECWRCAHKNGHAYDCREAR